MATAAVNERAAASQAAARDYWETKSIAYDALHDRLWVMLNEVVRLRPASLLDVGCAAGEVARGVTSRLPGIDYYGCDISHAAVAKLARPNVVQCDLNVTGVPFAHRRFDCVVASGICEYLRDQGAFLRQLADRLSPQGRLVVSYVNVGHFARRWRRLLGKRPRDNSTWQSLVPLTDFEAMLRRANLRVERRIATNGRLGATSELAARLSPLRKVCAVAPAMLGLLAPQVVFVCSREAPGANASGSP